jgi:hypothetical protein
VVVMTMTRTEKEEKTNSQAVLVARMRIQL